MNESFTSTRELAQPHRKAVLVPLLWLTAISGAVFATLNIRAGNYPLAGVEIVMAVYSVILMVAVRRTHRLERWILAYTLPFFTAMMFAMSTHRATVSVFGWVLLVPILSHLLHGRKLGLAMSIFFVGVTAVIFLVKFHDSPIYMQPLPLLNMGIMTLCVLTFSHVYEVSRERSENQLMRMAKTDFLTGLGNRAMFKEVFEREASRSQRELMPLSLIVIDLDYFKAVNDEFGHDVGDQTLIHVARILRKRLRLSDIPCRLGGEEFGVLLPDTSIKQALIVAEDLRATLAAKPLVLNGLTVSQTLSVGVAEIGADGSTLKDLLSCADERLYAAKAGGRNCVVGPEWVETGSAPARA